MNARKVISKFNPLPWIVDNVFKSLMGFMAIAAASGIWMLVLFFWNVPARLSDNQREHLEFKARLDSLEKWTDETESEINKRIGQVYKKENDDMIDLYKLLLIKKR